MLSFDLLAVNTVPRNYIIYTVYGRIQSNISSLKSKEEIEKSKSRYTLIYDGILVDMFSVHRY